MGAHLHIVALWFACLQLFIELVAVLQGIFLFSMGVGKVYIVGGMVALSLFMATTILLIYGIVERRERFMVPSLVCTGIFIITLGLFFANNSVNLFLYQKHELFAVFVVTEVVLLIIVFTVIFALPTVLRYNEIKCLNTPQV